MRQSATTLCRIFSLTNLPSLQRDDKKRDGAVLSLGYKPPMWRRLFVCSALVTLSASILLRAAEPESADLRYFRELVETRNYSLGQPVSPQLTPDGKAVIFLRGGARDPVLRLYEFTIADNSLREILTPEKLLQGGEEKLTAEEKSRSERERQSLKGFTSF